VTSSWTISAPVPTPSPTPSPSPTPTPTPVAAAPTPPFQPGSPSGTTYYVSDCKAGAESNCVVGNDAADGKSLQTPWQTIAKLNSMIGTMKAGDQILMANGGSWSDAGIILTNYNVTPAQPLTLDAYTPSWSSGKNRPILLAAASGQVGITLSDMGGPYIQDGGYNIRNLDIRGGGTGNWGVFLYDGLTHVFMDHLSVTGFTIGIHINPGPAAGSNANSPTDPPNPSAIKIVDVIIQNSNISNNAQHGILADADNLYIANNTLTNNGYGSCTLNGALCDANSFGEGFTHGIYLGAAVPSQNVVVYNNVFTDNTVAHSPSPNAGKCVSGPLVVHGQWNNVLVQNNVMTQQQSAPGCYGISIKPDYNFNEWMLNFVVRGNIVVNMGNVGIALTSVPGIIVEDNVIINNNATFQEGIQIPVKARNAGDAADNAALIRNNSIYFASAASGSIGIDTNGVRSDIEGSGYTVVNNLIYFGSGSASGSSCFMQSSLAKYAQYSNNLCYSAGSSVAWSSNYANLAAAQAAGFDQGGLSQNPQLAAVPSAANNWSMSLGASSPAISAGSSQGGAAVNILGHSNGSSPNIGAY
jgi:hypothetical protein